MVIGHPIYLVPITSRNPFSIILIPFPNKVKSRWNTIIKKNFQFQKFKYFIYLEIDFICMLKYVWTFFQLYQDFVCVLQLARRYLSILKFRSIFLIESRVKYTLGALSCNTYRSLIWTWEDTSYQDKYLVNSSFRSITACSDSIWKILSSTIPDQTI